MSARAGEAGYTLVEMLAAMAILGMAMAGLAEGVHAIGTAQRSAALAVRDDETLGRARSALVGLLGQAGPYFSDEDPGFRGESRRFSYPCGSGDCGASLRQGPHGDQLVVGGPAGGLALDLPRIRGARFAYVDDQARADRWPAADAGRQGRPHRLQAVAIVAGQDGDAAVALARLQREEPSTCEFDAVTGDCRRSHG